MKAIRMTNNSERATFGDMWGNDDRVAGEVAYELWRRWNTAKAV